MTSPVPSQLTAPELTERERTLSLAAVISAAFGVGLAFGIGFPLTSLTLESWGASKWVVGVAGATPALAVLCALPFLPGLIARLGAVPALAGGCLLAGVTFAGLSFAETPTQWIALRFVMSAGLALPWLVGETWINTVTTDGTRGRVIAIYAIAFFLGFSAGPWLLDRSGGTAGFGAAIGAFSTALAGVPILLARRLAPDLTRGRAMPVKAALALAPVGMLGALMGGFAEGGYLSLFPNVVLAAGGNEASALSLLTLLTLGGGMLQFPLGWLADKTDKERLAFQLAAAFVVLSLMLPWALAIPLAAAVLAFILGGVILGFYTLGLAIVGDKVDAHEIAAANAAFLVMYQVGGIVGPLAAGAAMTVAPVPGFVATVVGLMLMSAVMLQVLRGRAPRHTG